MSFVLSLFEEMAKDSACWVTYMDRMQGIALRYDAVMRRNGWARLCGDIGPWYRP